MMAQTTSFVVTLTALTERQHKSFLRAVQCSDIEGCQQEAVYEYGRSEAFAEAYAQVLRQMVGECEIGKKQVSEEAKQ